MMLIEAIKRKIVKFKKYIQTQIEKKEQNKIQ